MTDHDALLRAIIDHPAEDTPRLALADWLDEHADALPTPAVARLRAQFIRDDIALSQLDEFDPPRLRWDLIDKPRRENEAWARVALPAKSDWVTFDRDPLFRRGFAWSVSLSGHGPALGQPPADAIPLERVRYSHCGEHGVEQLRAAAWRGRLTAIEFERGISPPVRAGRLFALCGLDRLERLAFRDHAISVSEVGELCGSALFARLAALTIKGGAVGAAVADALARAGPNRLRELHLVNCRVAPAALESLLASPAARALESLSVGGDRIGAPEKFRAFGRVPAPRLRSLDMSADAPNEAGLEALLAAPLAPGLRRLALARCNLNSARTRLLASGPFAELRALDLSNNLVGNEGAVALAAAPHLANLLVLNLGYAQVGDEGVRAILESPLAERLVLLDLTGSPASEETKEELVGRMGDRVRV